MWPFLGCAAPFGGSTTLAVWAAPTMVGDSSDGKRLLAHPPRIALRWRFEEEELVLWHEVLLDE